MYCFCALANDSLVTSNKECWCWWTGLDTTIEKVSFTDHNYITIIYVYYKITDQYQKKEYFVRKSIMPAIGKLNVATFKLNQSQWEKFHH
jgi:hypothetical protein